MVGRQGEQRVERWQRGVIAPIAGPARRYCRRRRRHRTPWPEASVCATQPSEVDDRGAADGECLEDALVKGKRGTKPLDSGHREEWDPRLDGGSTSLIVAIRGAPELTAAARHPRSRQRTSGPICRSTA